MTSNARLRRTLCLTSLPRPGQLRALTVSRPRLASTTAQDAALRLLDKFAGSVSVRRQVLDANQLQKLALTLGRPRLGDVDVTTEPPPVGTPIPPGHHLVYFTPGAVETQLGPDGTDLSFNAPEPFTRRMWAGGQMSWPGGKAALLVGDEAEEHTRLISATAKRSRAGGDMVLVGVEKEIRGPRGSSVVDRRSWMFRPRADAGKGGSYAVPASEVDGPSMTRDVPAEGGDGPGSIVRQVRWSPVGLFRFSALTFNGHKIHYSQEWCRDVEHHPTLVVHGPLNLMGILDYWRDVHGHGSTPASIDYRALSPVYAGETYQIRTRRCQVDEAGGRRYEIVAEKDGMACMKSEVLA